MSQMNMMGNGMPGPNQVNGMQRPQPGNMKDQIAAQISNNLRQELPKFQNSWQATCPLGGRLAQIIQLFTQLKFLENDIAKCLRTAVQFENETISRAPDYQVYNQTMMRKLADISTKRNQNINPMTMNGNGPQMTGGHMQDNHMMNPGGNQMPPRVQQTPNMGMPQQQMPNNGMNQLGAPGMQPSMSQNGHQQPPQRQQPQQQRQQQQPPQQMNANANSQQGVQFQSPSNQEVQELAGRMIQGLSEDKKTQMRGDLMRSMSEQQRQQHAASKKDPLIGFVFQRARNDLTLRARQAAQGGGGQGQQNMQMANAGGVSMAQSASQQGNGFDFTAIMGQQANALKLQESGNEVVPASNNPNNQYNNQQNQQNAPPSGINPAMLGKGNGQGGPQMPAGMTQQQQMQMLMQNQKLRQEQARRSQNMQQASHHGQGMGAQNALNGAAGGSPAMTMLNRPMQPPGSQTPNTPQQPNRAPNMQQPNMQQHGQTPVNGANALQQHHQSMMNRSNSGVNIQQLIASMPPHPMLQMPQAQEFIRMMPAPVLEKFRTLPGNDIPVFLKRWAQQAQQQRNQNANQQNGGPPNGGQATMGGVPNGMPDMNMQQAMLQQGQSHLPPGVDQAQLQARMLQQQQQQQQQQQRQQQQQQQPTQQQQQLAQMQHMPAHVVEQLQPQVKNAAMYSRPFPPPVLQQLGIAVPPQCRLWGHLRVHVEQNGNMMQPGTMERLMMMMHKWFNDNPAEFQAGVRQVLLQRQQNQRQQQPTPQGQNVGQQANNMGNMGLPNGAQGGAPTAQMMQPAPQAQQAPAGPPMGMGPGQPGMPPQTPLPVSSQEIALFRQRFAPQSQNMGDEQIRNFIEANRRKQSISNNQHNALKQAQQQQQQQPQNALGNQQQRPNRTPGQAPGEQMPVQQQHAGQKRPQPPTSANDDVMEIPNPNAQQPPQPKARPAGFPAGMKFPNFTKEQIAKMTPEQQEQLRKRMESLRQANAGTRPVASEAPPVANEPTQSQQATLKARADIVTRIYKEISHAKGQPVQVDPAALEQITAILKKVYPTYAQVDKIFSAALAHPEFTEARVKKLAEAKIMVYHNWDPTTGSIKAPLSLTLQQAHQVQRLISEFLGDMNKVKMRGNNNQKNAQQPQNQAQAQEQQQAAAMKQPSAQVTPMEKNPSKHGRKASASSKPPPAPTDNKTFDWGPSVSSPHGVPKYDTGASQLTPDKLKFPPNKRRRTGQPESAGSTPAGQGVTPSGASPNLNAPKSNSPEQLRKAQVQARTEAEEKVKKQWKCFKDPACQASIDGFETEAELKAHFDSDHKEVENPLQFLLDSAAQSLGVDLEGKPLPGKAANMPKPGARLLPPKAAAMKRESSLTPSVKQEARTPAGQAVTPAPPGSGGKTAAKPAGKHATIAADTDKTKTLQGAMADKMGYQPLPATDSATSPATAEDQLWTNISSTLAPGFAQIDPFSFDGFSGAQIDDWGLRLEDTTGVPSSPETTPESSSSRSQNSDISTNDRMRINFEWDAFGNGDTLVPEALSVAVGDMGLGGSEKPSEEKPKDDGKKEDGDEKKPAVDTFNWAPDNDMSWDSMFAAPSDNDVQFDFTGGSNEVEMDFIF